MDKLKEVLENGITREWIDKIFMKAATENAMDINLRYASALEEYFQENPEPENLLAAYLLVSMCVAHIVSMDSVKAVLCELLGIEDTTAADDVEEESQANQHEQ